MGQISVWVHDSQHDRIKEWCKERDITVAKWVRMLIAGEYALKIEQDGDGSKAKARED